MRTPPSGSPTRKEKEKIAFNLPNLSVKSSLLKKTKSVMIVYAVEIPLSPIPDIALERNSTHMRGKNINSVNSIATTAKEINRIGFLPLLSEMVPMMGPQKNSIMYLMNKARPYVKPAISSLSLHIASVRAGYAGIARAQARLYSISKKAMVEYDFVLLSSSLRSGTRSYECTETS